MRSPSPEFMHGLVRKEARSLLQYIGESFPWAAPDRQKALHTVLELAKHEANQVERLIRWCNKSKLGNPALGAYPQSFMGINFASLEFLLPLLVEDQKRRIADLEWALLSVPTGAEGMVRDLIVTKKKHLEKMESLAVPASAS
jgi:hypothetical protein